MSERTLSYAGGAAADRRFAAPYLALALECERPLASPSRRSIAEVERVEVGRGEPAVARTVDGAVPMLTIAVADLWMSTRHARFERAGGGWRLVDLGSKNGTFVAGRAIHDHPLVDGDVVEIGSTLLLYRDAVLRDAREPADLDGTGLGDEPGWVTLSIPWGRGLADLARLARGTVPIVLHGASGTGKEVLARGVHRRSGRGPFVAVNCGALPETLVESELFGHRKGAFSGASDERPGLIRAAHGGTLFLDEIGELPPAAQVKLLRVLQEGEVLPLGGQAPVPVDVRVVCASHARPSERLRPDLYARLAGHVVELPTLAERREDLGLLIASLLRRHLGPDAQRVRIDRDAARALFAYGWPLNVRELEQALRAALALSADLRLALAHLPPALRAVTAAAPDDADRALRAELLARFAAHAGSVSAVAREMGKDRVQIRRWCKRLGIDPDGFR